MSYDTFDWSVSTGVGWPTGFEAKRRSLTLVNESDAGYRLTRPAYTKDTWIFNVEWSILRPESFVYLVDFFHDHRGGLLFYFRIPWGLYGIPPEYETADPGGLSPWSSEVEPGYGEAPTYLVRFDPSMQELPLKKATQVSCWATSSPIGFHSV